MHYGFRQRPEDNGRFSATEQDKLTNKKSDFYRLIGRGVQLRIDVFSCVTNVPFTHSILVRERVLRSPHWYVYLLMRTHNNVVLVGVSEACFSCSLLARGCQVRAFAGHEAADSIPLCPTLLSFYTPPPSANGDRIVKKVLCLCVTKVNIFALKTANEVIYRPLFKKKKLKKPPWWVAPFSFARR